MIVYKIRGTPLPVTLLKKCCLPVKMADTAGENVSQYYLLCRYCYPDPRHCDVLLYRNSKYLCSTCRVNWPIRQLRTMLYIYDMIDSKPEGACS